MRGRRDEEFVEEDRVALRRIGRMDFLGWLGLHYCQLHLDLALISSYGNIACAVSKLLESL